MLIIHGFFEHIYDNTNNSEYKFIEWGTWIVE